MASEPSQAQLNLTPEEKRVYGQLFKQADPENLGVVTGDVAVDFFKRTKLDGGVLGEIWQIADAENRGLLTPAGFSSVLRLIGHCQSGRTPSLELAMQPGPLPRFEGLSTAPVAQSPIAGSTSISAQNTGTPGPIRVPPLTPDKVNEYSAMFERAGAQNGFLSGDIARSAFERARLSNEALGQIWGLSDVQARGALNVTEFVVAMHLINSMRNGHMRALPQTLPQGLWDAAARRSGAASVGPIPRQFSGAPQPQRTASPLARQQFSTPPVSAQTTGTDWLITPADKAKFDNIFDSVDTGKRGFITGDQAVTFFSNSGLSEDALASIWDLADINSAGQLSRDEFAVAMYLIRQQKAKRDGRSDLPTSLPPRLIPPSMRQSQAAATASQTTAPAFDNEAFATTQPKGAAEDLFGLDALTADTSFPPATGPASPTSPPRAATTRAPVPGFKPFVPTSSFGVGLAQQNTGGSVQSNQSQPRGFQQQQASAADDLLGDNDPEISNKLTSETSDLANMSSQVGTLRTQMGEVQNKKAVTERDLSAAGTQRKELEARLAQFRTQYEKEIREVKALEEKLNASRADTKKMQQELAMVEGAHADLKNQHQQISLALDADQKENASLKERLRTLNAEVAQIKPQIEKLQTEARQQKGLVAINKKQVSTSEGERDRVQAEKGELEKAAAEREAAAAVEPATVEAAGIETTSRDLPGSGVVSPAPSTASRGSMNPFFRKSSPQQSFDQTMSPSIFTQNFGSSHGQASTFDSMFGPSETTEQAKEMPPSTSFPAPPLAAEPEVEAETSRPETPKASAAAVSDLPETPQPVQEEPPPPPPTVNQITSSSLPLRPSALEAESYSSSVRANAPSATGDSDISTPIRGTPTLEHLRVNDERPATGASRLSQNELADNVASPLRPDIPGAFPGDTETQRSASAASVPEDKGFDDTAKGTALVDKANPLAPVDGSKAASSTKDDEFESAFADLPSASNAPADKTAIDDAFAFKPTANGAPRTKQEFPPIQDLEHDDESDSDADNAFEDSFTTQGANRAAPAAVAAAVPNSHAHENSIAAASSQPATHTSTTSSDPPAAQAASSKAPAAKDDFDSAFDDLDEAKEDEEQEAFASSTQHKEHEFNPTFESPAPSKVSLGDFGHTPSGSTQSAAFPKAADNFESFTPSVNVAAPPTSATAAAASSTGKTDWDDIFAGLDEAPAVGQNGSAKSPFDLDVPGESSTAASKNTLQRPSAPARAISAGTEHDDPILKSLTGMGFARGDALKALEKYDYNLDKAADYLTSKH